MQVYLTPHSLDEWRKHSKCKGGHGKTIDDVSNYYSSFPILISSYPRVNEATPFLPRFPPHKERTYLLTRGNWKYADLFLVLVERGEKYIAKTTLSGREFRADVKKKKVRISNIKEIEDLGFLLLRP